MIAFIPAKGYSVRIPHKNLQKVHGKSLVGRSTIFALNQINISTIVISTNSNKVIKEIMSYPIVAKNRKKIEIHWRNKNISNKNISTFEVMKNFLESSEISHEEDLVLLQPTSPFRNVREFKSLLRIYSNLKIKSLASVSKNIDYHGLKTFSIKKNGKAKPLINYSYLTTPIENLPPNYSLDGGYYINRISTIHKYHSLLHKDTTLYIRKKPWSINIDTPAELIEAQNLKLNYLK